MIHVVISVITMILTIVTIFDRKKNQKSKYATYVTSRSTNSSKSTKKSENRTALHNNPIIDVYSTSDKTEINNNQNYIKSNKISLTAPDSINDLR